MIGNAPASLAVTLSASWKWWCHSQGGRGITNHILQSLLHWYPSKPNQQGGFIQHAPNTVFGPQYSFIQARPKYRPVINTGVNTCIDCITCIGFTNTGFNPTSNFFQHTDKYLNTQTPRLVFLTYTSPSSPTWGFFPQLIKLLDLFLILFYFKLRSIILLIIKLVFAFPHLFSRVLVVIPLLILFSFLNRLKQWFRIIFGWLFVIAFVSFHVF